MNNRIETGTVKTNSLSMDYMKFGQGDKTMVIIPGLSVDSVMKYSETVADAYSPLTEEFTIYLFDRRSDLPAGYTLSAMADNTAAAINDLGLNNIYLFGASQGGMISILIAINNPGLVSKLVLGSSAAAVDKHVYDNAIAGWVKLAQEKDGKSLYLSFGEALYPPAVFEQSKDLLIQGAAGITEEDLSRFVILAETMKGFDILDRLTDITCPLLILGSNDDRVIGGEASEAIYGRLSSRPDCELYMYDGFGHAAYDLAPDYKNRILEFFLK